MNECLKIYRAAHACVNGPKILRPMGAILRHLDQLLFSCHIGSHAKIGNNCIFQHNGLGVVISEHASPGEHCVVYQHVTVGALDNCPNSAPEIGNGVTIGAGASILGPISVGEYAKIGAGAVVLQDVPAWSTAVGVPARIIRSNQDYKVD